MKHVLNYLWDQSPESKRAVCSSWERRGVRTPLPQHTIAMGHFVRTTATHYRLFTGSKQECLDYWVPGWTQICWIPDNEKPIRKWSEETKAKARLKRKVTKINKQYPLLADLLIETELGEGLNCDSSHDLGMG